MMSFLSFLELALGDHLWQSTAFAGAIWIVTLLLRRNQARVRYGLWLAASIKFFLPFSLFVELGSLLPVRQHVAVSMPVNNAVDAVSQPFFQMPAAMTSATAAPSPMPQFVYLLPVVLAGAWLCGVVVVLAVWGWRWLQVAKTLRQARRIEGGREWEILERLQGTIITKRRIPLLMSQEMMEPGVFGVFRPVLIWPERLSEWLDDKHIESILAHELMHVRQLDNFAAALHMAAEALFWFHPLVWWMERQMVEERERACDEAVIEMGSRPGTYAEGLLKACRFCVESPLVCVAGITGADLNRRVRSIMTLRLARLTFARKLMLASLAIAAVALPIAWGTAQQPQSLRFEAAAIKPGDPKQVNWGTTGGGPGGQYHITNMPLKNWVEMGLSVQDYALQAPPWLDTPRFDLTARLPNQPINQQAIAEMMKALLIERFGLKWHEVTQPVPGYELVTDKKVLMQPASLTERLLGQGGAGSGPSVINGKNMSMSQLAELLGKSLGRPVVDATHLTGGYDLEVRWRPEDEAELAREKQYGKQYGIDVDNLPDSAFTAVREQLGLRLQPAKVPGRVVVIDHIDSQPSAN